MGCAPFKPQEEQAAGRLVLVVERGEAQERSCSVVCWSGEDTSTSLVRAQQGEKRLWPVRRLSVSARFCAASPAGLRLGVSVSVSSCRKAVFEFDSK